MNQNMEAFLQADELNNLASLAKQAAPLDAADATEIKALVEHWTETQALANLLMYPDIIPSEIRFEALLKGLQSPVKSYLVVAATIGLQRVVSQLSDAEQKAVLDRLLEIIPLSPPTAAGRASVTLSELSRADYADRFVVLLGHPGDMIKHNVLVALIKAVGFAQAQVVIDNAFAERRLIRDGKVFAEAHLAKAKPFVKDGQIDSATWYQSDLSAPLLPYISNFKDYSR